MFQILFPGDCGENISIDETKLDDEFLVPLYDPRVTRPLMTPYLNILNDGNRNPCRYLTKVRPAFADNCKKSIAPFPSLRNTLP